MSLMKLRPALALLALFATLSATAQEAGYWRAASSTARSITGDLGFGSAAIAINFANYSFFRARTLKPEEIAATFSTEKVEGQGSLFRITIPGGKLFLHKNTLCGKEDVHWMTTYVAGRDLQVAFFSGSTPPVLTAEAFSNSTDLCGTFSYTR